jgi:hypothetical protein
MPELERAEIEAMTEPPPSPIYKLFEQAMVEEKQILCSYDGYPREVCPVLLGHKDGQERASVFQFGGNTSKGKKVLPNWRCLDLPGVSEVQLRDGLWHTGTSHKTEQKCIEHVDLDVNPNSPYRPRRDLAALRKSTKTRRRK